MTEKMIKSLRKYAFCGRTVSVAGKTTMHFVKLEGEMIMSLKRCLTILLVLCAVLGLCACGGTQTPTQPQTQTQPPKATDAPVETSAPNPTYTVKVVDESGNPIAGAIVQLCLEACYPNVTKENGVAEFAVAEADYKVSFTKMPNGYTYSTEQQEFHFEEGSYEMTITLKAAA